MVGKVEAGIPEDDPRNPATIADNVGDNVGDCAGMAADLFETFAVTTVATMVLASIYFTGEVRSHLMLYPLAISATCILTSIIGTFFVRLGASKSIMGALYKGVIATGVLSIIALWPLTDWIVGMNTQTVTSSPARRSRARPVHLRRRRSRRHRRHHLDHGILHGHEFPPGEGDRRTRRVTGHGTNVIQGLAISMESTALPALVICVGIIAAYLLAGTVRHRDRGVDHAVAGRHDRCARCLRPGDGQCRAASPKWRASKAMCARRPMRSTRSATPPRP